MAVDQKIDAAIDTLIAVIRDTDEYKKYEELRKIVVNDPDLCQKVNRSRVIRKQLNEMPDYERDSDRADYLVDEYDRLMDTTALHEFSLAEHGIIKMYREVSLRLTDSFELDLEGDR